MVAIFSPSPRGFGELVQVGLELGGGKGLLTAAGQRNPHPLFRDATKTLGLIPLTFPCDCCLRLREVCVCVCVYGDGLLVIWECFDCSEGDFFFPFSLKVINTHSLKKKVWAIRKKKRSKI